MERSRETWDLKLGHPRQLDSINLQELFHDAFEFDSLTSQIPGILSTGNHQYIVATNSASRIIGVCVVSSENYPGEHPLNIDGAAHPGPHGYIDSIAVHPEAQGQGIGKMLLEWGLGFLKSIGCRTARVRANPPHYAFAGVDVRYLKAICLLEGSGFKRESVVLNLKAKSHNLKLVQFTRKKQEILAEEGVDFRYAMLPDEAWLKKELSGRWKPSWVDEVLSLVRPIQRPRPRGLAVAIEDGIRLVGFCGWGMNRSDELGPLGVAPERRNIGIGSTLLGLSCQAQAAAGIRESELQWAGPIKFFSHTMQAQTSRALLTYWKAI
ncbi:GNAT family N-acetyltransferase [Streptomyces sp. NPDC021056]|uniref:GNAT family N-acetyltransferase n=1 Tax=Streptomyces sp. NPDC021056 TaxID=3155012 RepID=UPI0034054554